MAVKVLAAVEMIWIVVHVVASFVASPTVQQFWNEGREMPYSKFGGFADLVVGLVLECVALIPQNVSEAAVQEVGRTGAVKFLNNTSELVVNAEIRDVIGIKKTECLTVVIARGS